MGWEEYIAETSFFEILQDLLTSAADLYVFRETDLNLISKQINKIMEKTES